MTDPSVASAELALHIVRFVQMPAGSPAWPERWVVTLATRAIDRAAAVAFLVNAPKPMLLAPLAEPGMLAIWDAGSVSGDMKVRIEHEFANQVEAVSSRVEELGLAETSPVLFETAAGRVELTVAGLRSCFRDFVIVAGWNLIRGPDQAFPARLVIRRSAQEWSAGGP